MKSKTILAKIIDKLGISFCIFLLSFIWCRKLITNNKISCFIIAGTIFIFSFVIMLFYILKNNNAITKGSRQKIFLINCMNFLKFCSKNEYISFVSEFFCSKYINEYYFKSKEKTFYINLRRQQNEKDFFEINEFYLNNKLKEIILVCDGYDEKFISLTQESNNNFILYNKENFIDLLQFKKIYPIKLPQTISKKEKIVQLINRKKQNYLLSITKKHFKDFFFSGISLTILSLFVPFASYYIYFGSVFLILSIISLFNNENKYLPANKLSLASQIKRDD